MAMKVEAEIRDLKRRVGELEGSSEFLTQQVKGVHRDLLAFEAKTEERFDQVDRRLDRVEKGLRELRHDMPGIVGSAMREVLRDRRGK
jgi:predicted  nucleic acid-binding Zn-ribbon protein